MNHRRTGSHQRPARGKPKLFHRTLLVALVYGTALLVFIGLIGQCHPTTYPLP